MERVVDWGDYEAIKSGDMFSFVAMIIITGVDVVGESCNDHLLLLRVAFSFIVLLVLIVLSVVERGGEERKKGKGCEGVLLLVLNGLKG